MSDRISGMIPVTVLEGESLSLKDGKMCSVWYKMKEGAVYFGTQLITQKSFFPRQPPPGHHPLLSCPSLSLFVSQPSGARRPSWRGANNWSYLIPDMNL